MRMLKLSNDERRQLREAIESAYPDPDDLKIFVREKILLSLRAVVNMTLLSSLTIFGKKHC
jgi:hypothetical protein